VIKEVSKVKEASKQKEKGGQPKIYQMIPRKRLQRMSDVQEEPEY
jgi:hypothetical protein